MTVHTKERRVRRSNVLYEALNMQIAAIKEDYGIGHVALANDDGLVMASSGTEETAEWMAAMAPGVSSGEFLVLITPEEVKGAKLDDDLIVIDFHVEGHTVYLAGLAGPTTDTKAGLEHASQGVKRIFEEARTR